MGTGVLDQLEVAISALAGVNPDALSDREIDELVVGLGGESIRLEALWCRLIRVWDNRKLWADDGSKAPGARLARETHMRKGRADRLVARGRQLDAMPTTAGAYACGEINGDHVDLIATCDRSWRNAEFCDHEATLVNLCRTPLFSVATQAVTYLEASGRSRRRRRTRRHNPPPPPPRGVAGLGW